MTRLLLESAWLLVFGLLLLLSGCHMPDPTNPIYREAPQTYFPAGPALQAAQAIRAEDGPALDRVFAQHPGFDPNQPGH